jgi:hypothetical protein
MRSPGSEKRRANATAKIALRSRPASLAQWAIPDNQVANDRQDPAKQKEYGEPGHNPHATRQFCRLWRRLIADFLLQSLRAADPPEYADSQRNGRNRGSMQICISRAKCGNKKAAGDQEHFCDFDKIGIR